MAWAQLLPFFLSRRIDAPQADGRSAVVALDQGGITSSDGEHVLKRVIVDLT